MRKFISVALASVFVLGVFAGMGTPQAEAANCYYTCTCEGNPIKCCVTPWGTFCKATNDIQCTQGYDC